MIKKNFFVIVFGVLMLIFSSQAFSQGVESINSINKLADKDYVTVEEGMKFFVMVTTNKSQSYNNNIKMLKSKGILDADFSEEGFAVLKRGILAKMVARQLELSGSLLYLLLDVERYATKACIADGIMIYSASERDVLSGGELIEIMTAVSVKMETGRQ